MILIILASLFLVATGIAGGSLALAFATIVGILVFCATEKWGHIEKMELIDKLNEARLDLNDEARPFAHDRTEAVCVRRCLDDQAVPTERDGKPLSLWGRVATFAGMTDAHSD